MTQSQRQYSSPSVRQKRRKNLSPGSWAATIWATRRPADSGAPGAGSHRRRHHVLRQLLGVPPRQIGDLDGRRPAGPSRQSLPDDEGLHPRTRVGAGHADAGTVAAPAAIPIISTCGRFTASPSITIPICSSGLTAQPKLCAKPKSRVKCGSSALPDTRIRTFILQDVEYRISLRFGADAAERLRLTVSQFRNPGACRS